MKRRTTALMAILTVRLVACNGKTGYNAQLARADSLTQVAVRYYDSMRDCKMQARAYYYWGSIY